MKFSERMGIIEVRKVMQVDSLDQATRNALWNLISPCLRTAGHYEHCTMHQDIWTIYFNNAIDEVPGDRGLYETDNDSYYRFFKNKFMSGLWNECLDFVEFLASSPRYKDWLKQTYDTFSRRSALSIPSSVAYNRVFEKFLVGYRFVNDVLTPVTNEVECTAIESAISGATDAVREQLDKALRHLSDRESPDYAKSIECSISAVEAQCRILLNDNSPTLGRAIKELQNKGMKIHPSLKSALEKLYGFTSDADGIRHGGISPSEVDQYLAKFMLVTCSAFIGYLSSAMTVK